MVQAYLKHLVKTAEEGYLSNIEKELSSLPPISSFLDVGCFTGENTLRMARALRATTISGFDINKPALSKAKRRGVKVFVQDIRDKKWKIKDSTYDFVYTNQVIEHLYSVDEFISNIKRILKPKGFALISTENLAGWHNIFATILGYQPFSYTNICTRVRSVGNPLSVIKDGYNDAYMVHRALFTYYALEKFIKISGLKIVKPITGCYYPFPNGIIGNTLARWDRRHAVYIAFVVQK